MKQFVKPSFVGDCLDAQGDGTGAIAFLTRHYFPSAGGTEENLDFVTAGSFFVPPQGVYNGREAATLFPQARGFSTPDSTGLEAGWRMHSWDSTGGRMGDGPWLGDGSGSSVAGADPRGGAVVAGLMRSPAGVDDTANTVRLYDTRAAPVLAWGPSPIASAGSVAAAGVDLSGATVVLTDGSQRFGAGHLSAQWFDAAGAPLTSEFDVISGWQLYDGLMETEPLIGGGVLVVQRLYSLDVPDRVKKLAVLEAGVAAAAKVPDWMSSRPNTVVKLTRGGQVYALIPMGLAGVACTQHVEIVAPDGTSCGGADYPIAGGSCTTKDMAIGLDGTVIQPLPAAMEETHDTAGGTARTCTWRWWSAAK